MRIGRMVLAVAVALTAGLLAAPAASQIILTVNTVDDVNDGTCDETHCSLREAILASNLNGGGDIRFAIDGEGPYTIRPKSALPVVTASTSIDGTTQVGYVGTPIVELDGTDAGQVHGLELKTGASVVRGLVINRFGLNGITLQWGAGGSVIQGNFVGTDVSGSVALGNGLHGISAVNSPGNTIGGTNSAQRNVVSGNAFHGIELVYEGTWGNQVIGNFVGTDLTGTQALGNVKDGVALADAPGNVIGGTEQGARNVISGSGWDGVLIVGLSSSWNAVEGNYIGTDVSGTVAIPNRIGVHIMDAPENRVGGSTPEAGNLLSGNEEVGLRITGADATGNTALGNLIGTGATGVAGLGNGGEGVGIHEAASANVVGGVGEGDGNVIAFNGLDGVLISSGTGNAVLGNSIHDNDGRGIDLGGDGRTLNDATDLDVGANNLQNYPAFTQVYRGSTVLEGTLRSLPLQDYRLEFFSGETCFGQQGETFLTATDVTTDAAGAGTFSITLQEPVLEVGTFVTATATADDNSTSEFSECAVVAGFDVTLAEEDVAVVRGRTAAYEVEVSAVGGPYGGEVALSCADLPAGAACTFEPTSMTPGGEGEVATLHVTTTDPDTPPGQATFTVTGASGSLTMSAHPTLTVTDFAVGLSPETLTVSAGQSATMTVTVSSQGGPFPDDVGLTCAGAPAGTTCSLSDATVSPGQGGATSTLTLVTSAGASSNVGGRPSLPAAPIGVPWLLALATVSAVVLAQRGRRIRRSLLGAGVVAVLLLADACGSESPVEPREPVTFTLTVEGTSGALAHAATASVMIRY